MSNHHAGHFAIILALTAALGTNSAQAQNVSEFPFFKNIWQNLLDQSLPNGVENPARLHAEFVAETRDPAWAQAAEDRIDQSLATFEVGTVDQHKTACKRSMCEVLLLIRRSSLPAVPNADEIFNELLASKIEKLSNDMMKKSSYAISNAKDAEQIAIALYIH